MLVAVIEGCCHYKQNRFMESNNLKFERLGPGRYSVLERRFIVSQEILTSIGYVFTEGNYHIFVPYRKTKPTNWFFGITRTDAIAGYLESLDPKED